MKIIIYFAVLLIFIILLSVFLFTEPARAMSMPMMVSVSALFVVYVIFMSLVGEGKSEDERALQHRYLSNRLALLAGTIILSVGVLYQLYNHNLDYWLLAGLVAINLVKLISLIYSHYRH